MSFSKRFAQTLLIGAILIAASNNSSSLPSSGQFKPRIFARYKNMPEPFDNSASQVSSSSVSGVFLSVDDKSFSVIAHVNEKTIPIRVSHEDSFDYACSYIGKNRQWFAILKTNGRLAIYRFFDNIKRTEIGPVIGGRIDSCLIREPVKLPIVGHQNITFILPETGEIIPLIIEKIERKKEKENTTGLPVRSL
ncbi:MAG: hypothetical protein AABX38_04515 [Candidatus Micrarchaeota archaeon]